LRPLYRKNSPFCGDRYDLDYERPKWWFLVDSNPSPHRFSLVQDPARLEGGREYRLLSPALVLLEGVYQCLMPTRLSRREYGYGIKSALDIAIERGVAFDPDDFDIVRRRYGFPWHADDEESTYARACGRGQFGSSSRPNLSAARALEKYLERKPFLAPGSLLLHSAAKSLRRVAVGHHLFWPLGVATLRTAGELPEVGSEAGPKGYQDRRWVTVTSLGAEELIAVWYGPHSRRAGDRKVVRRLRISREELREGGIETHYCSGCGGTWSGHDVDEVRAAVRVSGHSCAGIAPGAVERSGEL
jgi:hypothetical protein